MSGSTHGNQGRTDVRPTRHPLETEGSDTESIDTDELLSLLSDEYARDIVGVISAEALPAREIADRLDVSRATVYRRLNRLEEAGILNTSMAFDPDGNHRQRFEAPLDGVVLSFEDGAISVENVIGAAG